jgi:hypothetical protein
MEKNKALNGRKINKVENDYQLKTWMTINA